MHAHAHAHAYDFSTDCCGRYNQQTTRLAYDHAMDMLHLGSGMCMGHGPCDLFLAAALLAQNAWLW